MVAPADQPLEPLDEPTRAFYLRAMDAMDGVGAPYLVGGAYALTWHAGIVRHTKDFDVFVRERDFPRFIGQLDRAGFRTDLTFPHWLAKAHEPGVDAAVDIIYNSGNGICAVDDEWIDHSLPGEVLGRPVRLCPPEETIWSKCFIMERERFDGADVAHMLLFYGARLDWGRLLRRFQGNERVLLSHLLLFGYAYPGRRQNVPQWVLDHLLQHARSEPPAGDERICQGTLLSREQYLSDLRERGFKDARLGPKSSMDEHDIAHWTHAIGRIK